MNIPLSKPDISGLEERYMLEVLRSGQLSFGPKLEQFEAAFKRLLNMPYAAAMNSGTSALHLAVKAAGLKPGDEVITTPYSFIASSNCLLYEGVTPVFTDIDPDTLNMDVKQIAGKITPRTKAILPVHLFGQTVQMDVVMNLAREHDLIVIEDACEALGAKWNKQAAGTFGDMSVFAFYPNKQITTGEGGILLTRNPAFYHTVSSLRNQGRDANSTWLWHDRIGYNYRMSDLQAAAGCAQMERLSELLGKREEAAERYLRMIREYDVDVQVPKVEAQAKISWFVFIVILPEEVDRQRVMKLLHEGGVQSRPYFPCIHLQQDYCQQFGYKPGDFPIAEKRSTQTLAIPFYPSLREEEQKYVIHQLTIAIERSRLK